MHNGWQLHKQAIECYKELMADLTLRVCIKELLSKATTL